VPQSGQDADQELWAEMWLYVREAGLCEGLFLWDIEESAANNAGLRIHCKTDPATGVDYLKMNSEFGPSFQPDPPYIQFPFDEWARVRVYVRFQARGGIVKIWVNRRKKTVILFLRHPIKGRLPLCMFWITKDSIDNVVHELHGRIPDVDVLETNRRGLFMLSPEIDRWLMRPPAWGRP